MDECKVHWRKVRSILSVGVLSLTAGLCIAPWLFGATVPWARLVVNGFFLIGFSTVLMGRIGYSDFPHRPILPHGLIWRILLGLNLIVLLWFFVAALNWTEIYDPEVGRVLVQRRNLPFLPSSHQPTASWLALSDAVGLSLLFWGLVLAFRPILILHHPSGSHQTDKAQVLRYPVSLKLFLFPLALNAVLLSLIGIAQRVHGTDKLLWLIDDGRGGPSHFGPYPYRSNAAQYLNLLWPVLFMVASRLLPLPSTRERIGGIFLAASAAICLTGLAATASRGGAVVAVVLFILLVPITILLLALRGHQRPSAILAAVMLTGVLASTPVAQLLWARLEKVPNVIPTMLPSKAATFSIDCWMVISTNRPFPLLRMYAHPTEPGFLNIDLLRNGTVQLSLEGLATAGQRVSKVIGLAPDSLTAGRIHFVLSWATNIVSFYINGQKCGAIAVNELVAVPGRPLPVHLIHIHPAESYIPRLHSCYLSLATYELALGEEVAAPLSDLSPAPVGGLPKPCLRLQLRNLTSPLMRFKVNLLSRVAIWQYTKQMLAEYPSWCGAGPGTFPFLYKRHAPFLRLVDPHVHQDLLEARFNLGWVGTALVVGLLIGTLVGMLQSGISDRALWGLIAAIAGCLVHSFADFPFHNYSVIAMLTALLAVGFYVSKLLPKGRRKRFGTGKLSTHRGHSVWRSHDSYSSSGLRATD